MHVLKNFELPKTMPDHGRDECEEGERDEGGRHTCASNHASVKSDSRIRVCFSISANLPVITADLLTMSRISDND
jgi:hypothetical protein